MKKTHAFGVGLMLLTVSDQHTAMPISPFALLLFQISSHINLPALCIHLGLANILWLIRTENCRVITMLNTSRAINLTHHILLKAGHLLL
jgi:hypothetical protein